MPKKTLLPFLSAALLLLFIAAVPLASSSSPGLDFLYAKWGDQYTEVSAYPGLTTTITVFLRVDSLTVSGINAWLELPEPLTSPSGHNKSYAWYSGPAPEGTIIPLTFQVVIPPSAPTGDYRFELHMEYYWGKSEEDGYHTFKLTVGEPIYVDVTPITKHLEAGEIQSALFKISYHGEGTATISQLTVTSTAASIVDYNGTAPFTISDQAVISVELYVPPGVASVPIAVSFTYTSPGFLGSFSQSFGIPVFYKPTYIDVTPMADFLEGGRIQSVTFKLSYYGEGEVTVSDVAFSSATASIIDHNGTSLFTVKPDKPVYISVRLYVPPGAASAPITISFAYTSPTSSGTILQNFGLPVFCKPKVTISQVEATKIGTSTGLKVQVLNVGDGEAKYVSVEVKPLTEGLRFDRESMYIGSLASGEMATSLFKIESASKEQQEALIVVQYADSQGNWFNTTKPFSFEAEKTGEVEAEVSPAERTTLLAVMGGLSVGLFIVGFVLGRYLRWRHEAP